MLCETIIYRLENWHTTSTGGAYLAPESAETSICGDCYGRYDVLIDGTSMTDGTRITTGPVVELEGRTVTTSSGSKYLLGAPDPTWVTWMAEKGIAFDPAKPLRWKK